MKKLVISLIVAIGLYGTAQAKKGEDVQEVAHLLDCQTYWIDKLPGAHGEKQVTVCFYEVSYYTRGKERKIVLRVQSGDTGVSFSEVNNNM